MSCGKKSDQSHKWKQYGKYSEGPCAMQNCWYINVWSPWLILQIDCNPKDFTSALYTQAEAGRQGSEVADLSIVLMRIGLLTGPGGGYE